MMVLRLRPAIAFLAVLAAGFAATPGSAQTSIPASAAISAPAPVIVPATGMTPSQQAAEDAASPPPSAVHRHARSSVARPRLTMKQRFDSANTTHDGHLTKAQAEAAGMKALVAHYDAVDKEHKGYVTTEDLRNYALARRQARAAAKAAGTSKAANQV
jgi:hypothetical protein